MKTPTVELGNSDWEEELLKDFASPREQGSVLKPPTVESTQVPVEIHSEYWRIFMAPTSSSIDFQIRNIIGDALMKPIPLTTLPNFQGLSSEDADTFLF